MTPYSRPRVWSVLPFCWGGGELVLDSWDIGEEGGGRGLVGRRTFSCSVGKGPPPTRVV